MGRFSPCCRCLAQLGRHRHVQGKHHHNRMGNGGGGGRQGRVVPSVRPSMVVGRVGNGSRWGGTPASPSPKEMTSKEHTIQRDEDWIIAHHACP